jgi:hypothetical protein
LLSFFFSLGVAALSKPLAAFSEVGLPAHLQPVEKADKVRWFVFEVVLFSNLKCQDELEEKAQRRARKLASQVEVDKQSNSSLAEWQKKADKMKKKQEIKQVSCWFSFSSFLSETILGSSAQFFAVCRESDGVAD